MYVAELLTEGLPPAELVKRAQRVRKAKKGPVCKGTGCTTRISAYNRNENGKPEMLCYRCQGQKEEQIKIAEDTTSRRKGICKHGHILLESGIRQGVCAVCLAKRDQERSKKKAEAKGRTYYPRRSYLVLYGLEGLMRERGLNSTALEKAVGIPNRSLRSYERDGVGCPPNRAMKLADYFGVSLEELVSPSQEVAM